MNHWNISRWWIQIYRTFTPIQFDFFQLGWFNHQLDFQGLWIPQFLFTRFHTNYFVDLRICGDSWYRQPPSWTPPPCKSWRLIYYMKIFMLLFTRCLSCPEYIYIHTYIHACIHTYIHTYLHTYLPTYLHTYIQTNIHTYIHTFFLPAIQVSNL